jgi:hypothetical protein
VILIENNEYAGLYKFNYTPCVDGCVISLSAKDVKKLISKVEVLTDLVKKIITTKESNDSEEDKNLSGDNDDDNDDSDKEPSEKDMWSKISELLGLTEEAK